MDPTKDHRQGGAGTGSSKSPAGGAPPRRPTANPPRKRRAWARKWWLILGAILGLAVLGVTGALVYSAISHTLEWHEEVALHDGGILVVTWQVWFVAGQPPHYMVGRQRLTFTHPTTGQPVVWEDPGTVGSRLNPQLLAVEGGRLFLVGLAKTGPDYDGFNCPTPPYIVFRYDAGAWVRVPLGELPIWLAKANLMGFGNEEIIRQSKRYVTAAQVEAYYERLRQREDTLLYGIIDRRLRNPWGLGCGRGAIERIYGVEKYDEWIKTGTWLDKSEAEALRLLRRKSEGEKP